MSDIELLPCPFCSNMHPILEGWDSETDSSACWVECGQCGCQSDGFFTRHAAIKAWNTRAKGRAEPSGGDVPGYVLVPKELQGEMLFEMWRAIATSINHKHETLKYVWRRTLDAAPKVSASPVGEG